MTVHADCMVYYSAKNANSFCSTIQQFKDCYIPLSCFPFWLNAWTDIMWIDFCNDMNTTTLCPIWPFLSWFSLYVNILNTQCRCSHCHNILLLWCNTNDNVFNYGSPKMVLPRLLHWQWHCQPQTALHRNLKKKNCFSIYYILRLLYNSKNVLKKVV